MLDAVTFLPQPPGVIVSSRLADESFWAEALQLGAFDVIAKPFRAEEVIRIAIWAARRWHDLYVPTMKPTAQRRTA
jgi:DNA-binding response OmpR family regulator